MGTASSVEDQYLTSDSVTKKQANQICKTNDIDFHCIKSPRSSETISVARIFDEISGPRKTISRMQVLWASTLFDADGNPGDYLVNARNAASAAVRVARQAKLDADESLKICRDVSVVAHKVIIHQRTGEIASGIYEFCDSLFAKLDKIDEAVERLLVEWKAGGLYSNRISPVKPLQ
jgi:hypothetical protein